MAGMGDRKRGLTSLIKSMLVCAVGRHQPWWMEKKKKVERL